MYPIYKHISRTSHHHDQMELVVRSHHCLCLPRYQSQYYQLVCHVLQCIVLSLG